MHPRAFFNTILCVKLKYIHACASLTKSIFFFINENVCEMSATLIHIVTFRCCLLLLFIWLCSMHWMHVRSSYHSLVTCTILLFETTMLCIAQSTSMLLSAHTIILMQSYIKIFYTRTKNAHHHIQEFIWNLGFCVYVECSNRILYSWLITKYTIHYIFNII